MPGLIALKVGGKSVCCAGPLSVLHCIWVIFPVMLIIPNQLKVNFILNQKEARNWVLLCDCVFFFYGIYRAVFVAQL